MIICDTSALFAIADPSQVPQHSRCRKLFSSTKGPLITTWPCIAELMHLARRTGGWPMQEAIWELVQNGELQIHSPDDDETLRTAWLMSKYRDRPMSLADASLVALAEHLDQTRIFTLDSDFYVYRLGDGRAFDVVP